MNPYNFSVLCFGFCSLIVGLFVLLKRQDETGKLYFLLSIFYAGWALPFSIKISDNISYDIALHAARIANCSAAFIPTVWFHFCLAYTDRLVTRKKALFALYGIPFLILMVSYTPWFISGLRPILSFKYYVTPGIFYHLMTLNYFVIVPFGFFQLIKKTKEVSKDEKWQFKGLFGSAFLSYVGGAFTFLPVYGIAFPQEGMFLLPIYPFALAYFIIKQKLFDVEELAQAAHRDKLTAIGVLAASINHEVKNPLFIIKGLAESCLDRQREGVFPSDKKALESSNDAMKRSIEQADRAMDIIKRLSLFAKAGIDSELRFESVNVALVLEDILPLVRYELAAQNIILTREIPQNLPEVRADRRYLEEILFNLIVNAIQAFNPNSSQKSSKVNWDSPDNLLAKEDRSQGKDSGKQGEIKVTASVIASHASSVIASRGDGEAISNLRSPRPKNGLAMTGATTPSPSLSLGERDGVRGAGQVIITIQDNGPGIPEDKLKDVFRPFYTTKSEGTGLGLYITKQLVEKIGGRIDVQSPPEDGSAQRGVADKHGKGTKFTVCLNPF